MPSMYFKLGCKFQVFEAQSRSTTKSSKSVRYNDGSRTEFINGGLVYTGSNQYIARSVDTGQSWVFPDNSVASIEGLASKASYQAARRGRPSRKSHNNSMSRNSSQLRAVARAMCPTCTGPCTSSSFSNQSKLSTSF
ncbi:hypothetical protein McanMca71_003768 [Microsporum canis]